MSRFGLFVYVLVFGQVPINPIPPMIAEARFRVGDRVDGGGLGIIAGERAARERSAAESGGSGGVGGEDSGG